MIKQTSEQSSVQQQ